MHTGIQHSCVLFMTSHTINSIEIRFCKPRLLFESGICVGMQLQKCRFYLRATSIRERLLFNGGFYTRLYGICFLLAFVRLPHRSLFSKLSLEQRKSTKWQKRCVEKTEPKVTGVKSGFFRFFKRIHAFRAL